MGTATVQAPVPLGKLRNDRDVPLRPQLFDLLAASTAANSKPLDNDHSYDADFAAG